MHDVRLSCSLQCEVEIEIDTGETSVVDDLFFLCQAAVRSVHRVHFVSMMKHSLRRLL